MARHTDIELITILKQHTVNKIPIAQLAGEIDFSKRNLPKPKLVSIPSLRIFNSFVQTPAYTIYM